MSNPVGNLISQALRSGGITDAEADEIIAAVNAPKTDQTVEADTLQELRALDNMIGRFLSGGGMIVTPQNAHRFGVCLRRYEQSPANKCR